MAALTPVAAGPAGGRREDGGAETRIDWTQVALIFGARWRITLRDLSRSKVRLVFTVLAWMVMAVGLLVMTAGAAFVVAALRSADNLAPLVGAAIHAAFLFSFVSLAITPALGLRGNEFLDVTKLFTLPVNHRTVFVASLLGIAASPGALFLTLPLAGAVVGWGGGAAAVAGGLLAVLLLALAGTALGQFGLLLFLDLFRSRKWRDVSRLLIVLVSAGTFSALRFAGDSALAEGLRAGLAAFDRAKDWLLPLPSWWAAHAVTGTGLLRWLPALALVPFVVWLVVLSARLQERAWFGEIEERRDVSSGPSRGLAAWIGRRIPGVLGGIAEKDVRLLLRDPSIRIVLIQQAAYSILPLVLAMFRSGRNGPVGPGSMESLYAGIALLPPLLSTFLAFNPLGTEGAGVQHALLGPAPRATILAAKVIALLAVVGTGLALLCGAGSFVVALVVGQTNAAAAAGRALLAAIEAPAAFTVFAAAGAGIGARVPVRIVTRDRRALRQTTSSNPGCVGMLQRAAVASGCAMLCIPVALAFHHPALARLAGRDTSAWLALSVPFAVAYAAFLAWAGARLGGALLARREEEVLEALTRSET